MAEEKAVKALGPHFEKGFLNDAVHGLPHVLAMFAHFVGKKGVGEIADAIDKVRAGGVPWLKILSTLIPLLATLLSGGTLDLPTIIAAILALLGGGGTPPLKQ